MKKILIILLLITTIIMQASCTPKETPKEEDEEKIIDPIDDNYRVFYQIFTGSFSDSNKDGIGDLKGIINRLDYLNDGNINSKTSLGVQGIWLTPIFSSPTYHKYDVMDYYKIDSDFGTMDDLKQLIDECHKRNVKLIIDLVINHTSSSHKWFSEFKNAHKNNDTTNKYYNYYSWATSSTIPSGRSFAKLQGLTDTYYECNFDGNMPELNFDNDDVRTELLNIAKYYLDMGIDGFRFDAAKYLYYGSLNQNISFWNWYMGELRKIKSDVYCVGEVWSDDSESSKYATSLNCFSFSASGTTGRIYQAASNGNVNIYANQIESYQKTLQGINKDAMIIQFISNHDMDRSAGYLTVASGRMYMAANLYILCSGSPFIYYGEEIGMKGNRGSAMTDANRRLAMLWGDGDTIKDPTGTTYDKSKQTNGTVKELINDSQSLLSHYRNVIKIRNKYPEIARGTYKALQVPGNAGGFLIEYNGSKIGIIHNTLDSEVSIDLSAITAYNFTQLLDSVGLGSAKIENGKLIIGQQTSVILK